MALAHMTQGQKAFVVQPLSIEAARWELQRLLREEGSESITFTLLEELFKRGDAEARWILGFGEKP